MTQILLITNELGIAYPAIQLYCPKGYAYFCSINSQNDTVMLFCHADCVYIIIDDVKYRVRFGSRFED